VVFLAGAVVICAAVYLVHTYGQEILSLLVSNERDTKAALLTEKEWAQRLEVPGVVNLHKVSEELYRGAQPTKEGMLQLKELGIKTIVNLRSFHSDRGEIGDTGLSYEHIYMKTWHAEDEEVVRFLKIVTDGDRTPAFVHCQRGADRTGTMCAIYRVAVQGWSKDEAIEEMTKGGFGFYSGWKNLINHIRELDIEKVKSKAGLNN
jgi:protein tyrosine/serine phosphatase